MIILAAYRTTTVVNICEDGRWSGGGNKAIQQKPSLTWTVYLTDSQTEEGGEAVGDKHGYVMHV